MLSFRKKAAAAAAAVVGAAALLAVITHFTGENPVSNAVRTVFSPFGTGLSVVSDAIEGRVNFIREAAAYKSINEQLVAENTELKKQNREISVYREENERLNELLSLKNSMGSYSTVAAKVTGYSSEHWYDKIQINKGTLDGIAEGNTVIAAEGIVGIITSAGPNWAEVETIIAPESAAGVSIARTGDIGVTEGDAELCRSSLCKLTFADKGANTIVGAILVTSGTGGIYPPDINVGTIREISADNMGTLNYATVEPMVDFSSLREVLVVNGVTQ